MTAVSHVCTEMERKDCVVCSRGRRLKPTPARITSSILEAIHAGVGLGLGPRLCGTLQRVSDYRILGNVHVENHSHKMICVLKKIYKLTEHSLNFSNGLAVLTVLSLAR